MGLSLPPCERAGIIAMSLVQNCDKLCGYDGKSAIFQAFGGPFTGLKEYELSSQKMETLVKGR